MICRRVIHSDLQAIKRPHRTQQNRHVNDQLAIEFALNIFFWIFDRKPKL